MLAFTYSLTDVGWLIYQGLRIVKEQQKQSDKRNEVSKIQGDRLSGMNRKVIPS